MQILNMTEEDFSCISSSVVEPRKYYDAFLKAEEILASAPKSFKKTSDDRLPELTSHIYRCGNVSTALYRKRDDAPEALINVWLSLVRQTAGWYIAANDIPAFKCLEKSLYLSLPKLFREPNHLSQISSFLAPYGIVLMYQEAFPTMKVDGAVFSMPSGQVVVALSLRYARLDYFWFTLMHELAHVVLHSHQLDSPILDDFDSTSKSLIEQQADRLGADSIIPRNEWRSCPARFTHSVEDIESFAEKLGIPPQCVAGRLRNEQNRYDLFSEMVNKYNVREILNGNKT